MAGHRAITDNFDSLLPIPEVIGPAIRSMIRLITSPKPKRRLREMVKTLFALLKSPTAAYSATSLDMALGMPVLVMTYTNAYIVYVML
jgi:hypothetical protein